MWSVILACRRRPSTDSSRLVVSAFRYDRESASTLVQSQKEVVETIEDPETGFAISTSHPDGVVVGSESNNSNEDQEKEASDEMTPGGMPEVVPLLNKMVAKTKALDSRRQ